MATFRVGQKVVCVSAVPHPRQELVVGFVYTVRATSPACCNGGGALIDVGLSLRTTCLFCGRRHELPLKRQSSFRPLIEDLTAELARKEADRLVEEKPERVNEPQYA